VALSFHYDDCSTEIQNSVCDLDKNSENTVVCQKLKFRGTEYKKGLFVITSDNRFGPGFERIILLLVKKISREGGIHSC